MIDICIPFKVVNVTKSLISYQAPMVLVFNATLQILSLWDFSITDANVLPMPSIMKIMAPVSVKMAMSKMSIHVKRAKAPLYAQLTKY